MKSISRKKKERTRLDQSDMHDDDDEKHAGTTQIDISMRGERKPTGPDDTGVQIVNSGDITIRNNTRGERDEIEENHIYNNAKWTKRCGIVVSILSIMMMVYGFSSFIYDFTMITQYDNSGDQSIVLDKNTNNQIYKEQGSEQGKPFRFQFDKLTFVFLQGLALLMSALTFIQGLMSLILVFRGLKSLRYNTRSGFNMNDFESKQEQTKKFYDFIQFLVMIQVVSCVAYSSVFMIVIKKAQWKFEEQQNPSSDDETLVKTFESMVIARCAFMIVFYVLGCAFSMMTFSTYRNKQKNYEDSVIGNNQVLDNSKLYQSQKPGNQLQFDESQKNRYAADDV
eukprot:403351716